MQRNSTRLPDIVIGGAPRSGTMFLCEVLAKHPGVHVARPFIPEPKICMTPAVGGVAEYRQRYADLFADAEENRVLIEKTSAYLENEAALSRLRDVLPDARFIFILREPVSRAFSNWRRSSVQGIETLPFAEAAATEGLRPNPLGPELAYARPFDYLLRGDYGRFAERWIEEIGRSRMLFILFENMTRDPQSTMNTVQDFIGIPRVPWRDLAVGRVNAVDHVETAIDASLEKSLRHQMQPCVERLARVCPELDLSVWGYTLPCR